MGYIQPAQSTTVNNSSALKAKYYDKLFLKVAEAKLIHQQLGQLDKKIEQGEGGYGTGVVQWTKWVNLPLVSAGQGEGIATTAIPMTALNVTGSTAQYDAAVSISDLLAYTSFGDVMKAAVERLAYNAGLSIDTVVRNIISTGGTLLSQGGVTGANWTGIPSTAVLTIDGVRRSVRQLRRSNAMEPEGGFFVATIHPDALYDLQADTTVGGWIDANKYTGENAAKLMSGEAGKLNGVRFLESSNAYVRGTAITASGSIYVTNFFGRDAFGVTKLQNLKTFVKGFGSGGTSDPTDKIATAGWKTTFGATVLNSAFFVSLSHAVSTTA